MNRRSRDWRHIAEQWRRLDYPDRAKDSEAIAAYWELPFWKRILPWHMEKVAQSLARLEKKAGN